MNQSELKSDLIAWLEQQWDKAVKDSETPDKELLEKYTFYDGLTTAYEFTIARLNSAEGTEAPTVRSGRFTASSWKPMTKPVTKTCNNPVEYDWEFDPDGVSRMTGEGDIPSGADDSTAIVEAFGHIAESIVDGERIASGGDAKWLRPLAAMLAARIPFVSGSVESGLSVDITSSEFLDCCRSVWIGADMHRGFGRYLNLRWDVGRREWVEASSGLAFVGADSQVAFMLETAMSENDGIRFDPMEGKEDAIQLFRLLLETAKSADIPVGWGT